MAEHVIAIGTSDEGYSTYFDKSCKEVGGYDPVILGTGQKWEGFQTGIKLVADWLETVPDTDAVLILDRYDLVVTNPLQPVFEFFHRRRSEVDSAKGYFFVSSEPATPLANIIFSKVNEKHVNTGSVMGTVRDLRAMFKEISKAVELADDQQLIIEYLNKHKNSVVVDIDDGKQLCGLYCGMFGLGSRLRFVPGGPNFPPGIKALRISGSKVPPALIHRPANADMSRLLADLGYDVDYSGVNRPGYFRIRVAHWLALVNAKIKNTVFPAAQTSEN